MLSSSSDNMSHTLYNTHFHCVQQHISGQNGAVISIRKDWTDKRSTCACSDVAVFSRGWMKTLETKYPSKPCRWQGHLSDSSMSPRFKVIKSVSVSFSLCSDVCVCVYFLLHLGMNCFHPQMLWFWVTVYDSHVSTVLWGIRRHINNEASCQSELLGVWA